MHKMKKCFLILILIFNLFVAIDQGKAGDDDYIIEAPLSSKMPRILTKRIPDSENPGVDRMSGFLHIRSCLHDRWHQTFIFPSFSDPDEWPCDPEWVYDEAANVCSQKLVQNPEPTPWVYNSAANRLVLNLSYTSSKKSFPECFYDPILHQFVFKFTQKRMEDVFFINLSNRERAINKKFTFVISCAPFYYTSSYSLPKGLEEPEVLAHVFEAEIDERGGNRFIKAQLRGTSKYVSHSGPPHIIWPEEAGKTPMGSGGLCKDS